MLSENSNVPGLRTASNRVVIRFGKDVNGPVRCLGYFAALDLLPDRFEIGSTPCGWDIVIDTGDSFAPAVLDRILARVSSISTFIDLKIAPIRP